MQWDIDLYGAPRFFIPGHLNILFDRLSFVCVFSFALPHLGRGEAAAMVINLGRVLLCFDCPDFLSWP